MAEHAKLAASSSHRWMVCTPSVELEKQFPDSRSVYAEEGSAAHALSEHKLRKFLKIPSKRPTSAFDCAELEDYTDVYVTFACEIIAEARMRSKDAVVLIEQRVDFSQYVPQGFGTGDLIIISDGLLEVCDLKYGRGVAVSAEHNSQMQLYALGALALFDDLYDIQVVKMIICQPRLDSLSTFEMTVDELLTWAEQDLKPKATMADSGEGEFKAGKHCRFCRAKATCRSRAEMNLELARYEFSDPALLTEAEVADILTKVDQLQSWSSDIWQYAQTEAISGRKRWCGFKVVEGRANRKYSNEEKVVESVLSTGKYDETSIYNRKIIGITEMERLLGKKQFCALLGNLIEKPAGKPALVPESDKRYEWNSAKADFK